MEGRDYYYYERLNVKFILFHSNNGINSFIIVIHSTNLTCYKSLKKKKYPVLLLIQCPNLLVL